MNNIHIPILASAALLASGGAAAQAPRPNIMIVLVDDMGYSDIGCYGSEIATPNIDALASKGVRYTQFYNTARSCPTRASLLTGLNPHMAGVGWMTNFSLGSEGYQGDLSQKAVTIPEVLRTAGYSTYMAGKWHVVRKADTAPGSPRGNWPLQRGFDRYYGTLIGAGSYYAPESLFLDNDPVNPGDTPGFFYTDQIADHAVQFLGEHKQRKGDAPFFFYVAFTAPHWPLHARQTTIDKYMARYAGGWDALRRERYERMVAMGILNPAWDLSSRDEDAPAWDSLPEQEQKMMIKRMAVYAAMVDEMDQALGRIVTSLKANGQFDDTLILFLSDNGGCAERISRGDTSYKALGEAHSFESYRLPWANASNTPFRLFKHWVHEGGISTPLVAHWPRGIDSEGALRTTPGCLLDLMPTCVALSGATYPTSFRGNPIPSMEGRSLTSSFEREDPTERYMFWEHEANCAARKGKWKVVSRARETYPFSGPWELYDLSRDRSELNDLAGEHPEIVKEMAAAWDHWASTHMVYPLDGRTGAERTKAPVFTQPEP